MYMNADEKQRLFKDIDLLVPNIRVFIDFKEEIDDINSFEEEMGVNIDMTKEQIAGAVLYASVNNDFMEINDYAGSIFVTFKNFFKTENMDEHKVRELEANLFMCFDDIVNLWNDFYESTLAILPEYAALHTDEILNACDITKEYCSLKARNEQDKKDNEAGRKSYTQILRDYDYGF